MAFLPTALPHCAWGLEGVGAMPIPLAGHSSIDGAEHGVVQMLTTGTGTAGPVDADEAPLEPNKGIAIRM